MTDTRLDRARRLAGELRANLRRRKAQARDKKTRVPAIGASRAIDGVTLREAIGTYLREDAPWADGRSFGKMQRAARAFADATGVARGALAEYLTELAIERAESAPRPVQMLTIGGSGSHWIGTLLQDAARAIFVGEVYFSQDVRPLLDALGPGEADRLIDAVELLHMFYAPARAAPRDRLRTGAIINSAHGAPSFEFARRYRLGGRSFELRRDPRDQVLSVTYRKPAFRKLQAPDATDEEYLRVKARKNRLHGLALTELGDRPEIVLRFEDVEASPAVAIRALCDALGMPCAEADLAAAIERRAPRSRAGGARWHAEASVDELRIIHGLAVESMAEQGYPLCDCQGRRRIPAEEHRPIAVKIEPRWRALASIAGFDGGDYWREFEGSGAARGDGRLRLRPSA
ncbi:MAG: hypothetical protein H7X93_12530, partial [Sphingomonadaceae bacterium]|nr:hypothetical protein [Sphingomonadaceae bacterium]